MKTLLATLALLLFAGVSQADSVWTYTGNSQNLYSMNPFLPPPANPCGCALTGTVTLADAWTPVSWDFTAGDLSFTNLNSTLSAYLGADDPHPAFAYSWYFFFTRNDGQDLLTKFSGSINDALDRGGNLSVGSNPGVWTDPPVSTPEPGSLLLLGAGLAAALSLKRPRKHADTTVWEPLA